MIQPKNRDPRLITDGSRIGFYEREYYPLSNFSSFQVCWRDETWMTSEHAYHGAKYIDHNPILAMAVQACRSAHDAFKFSRANTDQVRSDWMEVRVDAMTDILRQKLGQHAYVRAKLESTADMELIEDSPKDGFWGIGADGQGHNQLGKIWMKLREELASGQIEIQG